MPREHQQRTHHSSKVTHDDGFLMVVRPAGQILLGLLLNTREKRNMLAAAMMQMIDDVRTRRRAKGYDDRTGVAFVR